MLRWIRISLLGCAGSVLLATTLTASAGWTLESVELNPVRFVGFVGNEPYRSLSGGLHLTDDTGRNEIAMPLLWNDGNESDGADQDYSATRVELQYRRYFRNEGHNGLYAGPMIRYARFSGRDYQTGEDATDGRFGIGAVFGQRIPFGNSRFYWGYSLSAGFLDGDEVRIHDGQWLDVSTDTSFDTREGHHFFDIEFAKFGFRF